MKKVLALFTVFAIFLSVAACSKAPADIVPTTVEVTEEPEIFASIDLVKDGASEFAIVHDGSNGAQKLANEVRSMLAAAFGVTMEVSAQTAENAKQIIIGNVDTSGEKALKKLTGEFDFTMKVEENALVLCAKNELSYGYLGQYLKRQVFAKGESADLTLDSENNIVYSKSVLMDTNYVDYWLAENTYFDLDTHFAYQVFKNAETMLPYRIYIPFNYTPEKSYPLLLNLHGAGLRGVDNQQHLNFIDEAMKNPDLTVDDAIIIFPQCPETDKWVDSDWTVGSYSLDTTPESNELKAVLELIGQLQQNYSIDETRIYAVGFSMGGFGTWNLLMNHPDLFAAGVPMCGAGDPSKASILKDIPIWAVHGAMDPTVPVSGSRDMAKALEAVGAKDFHYTEIADAQHDVWNYTYSNAEIFTWLFSQKKSA